MEFWFTPIQRQIVSKKRNRIERVGKRMEGLMAHIFIIEDNRQIRSMLRKFLEQEAPLGPGERDKDEGMGGLEVFERQEMKIGEIPNLSAVTLRVALPNPK